MFRTLLIAIVVTALGAGAAVYTLSLSETDNGASEPTCTRNRPQPEPSELISTEPTNCCGSHGLQVLQTTPSCCEALGNSRTAKKSYRLFSLELTAAPTAATTAAN